MMGTHDTIRVGFGRHDMSAFEPEMTMFGWGDRKNRARRIHTPLHARSVLVVDPSGEAVVFLAIEALLVAQGLWYAIADTLEQDPLRTSDGHTIRLTHERLVMVATHTHSGPSGYGHHFWETFNAPGFSPPVFAAIRDAVLASIREAARNLQPAEARLSIGEVPLTEGVAFNRSWFAYNRNRDVTPVTKERRDEATDRRTTVLRFHAPPTPDQPHQPVGRLIGLVHWFASHGTAIHADNDALHPDHKGLVALALESEGLGVVCAQDACGDVSPNYRWDSRRRHTIGRFDNDLMSAQHVADAQLRELRRLIAMPGLSLSPTLKVATRYVDFSNAFASSRFTFDQRDHTTTPALLGISMAQGTAEGPGPLRFVRAIPRALNTLAGLTDRLRGLRSRPKSGARVDINIDPKFPFIDLARGKDGKLLGAIPIHLTPGLDPTFQWVGDAIRNGGVHAGSWIPQTFPINLIQLGSFAIAACPFEMTTVSGRRVRQAILDANPDLQHVVTSPYANAYVGYMTTFEEYQVQHYEAGYTVFGPHGLAALQTAFYGLARDLQTGTPSAASRSTRPPRVPTDHLHKVRFSTPWPD